MIVWFVVALWITISAVEITRACRLDKRYSEEIVKHKKLVENYEESKTRDSEDDAHFHSIQRAIGFYEALRMSSKEPAKMTTTFTIATIMMVLVLTVAGINEDVRLLVASIPFFFIPPLLLLRDSMVIKKHSKLAYFFRPFPTYSG